jgi:hypothetical protein
VSDHGAEAATRGGRRFRTLGEGVTRALAARFLVVSRGVNG